MAWYAHEPILFLFLLSSCLPTSLPLPSSSLLSSRSHLHTLPFEPTLQTAADYWSMPQGDKIDWEDVEFRVMLANINLLCAALAAFTIVPCVAAEQILTIPSSGTSSAAS